MKETFFGIYFIVGFVVASLLYFFKYDKEFKSIPNAEPQMYSIFFLTIVAFYPIVLILLVKEYFDNHDCV